MHHFAQIADSTRKQYQILKIQQYHNQNSKKIISMSTPQQPETSYKFYQFFTKHPLRALDLARKDEELRHNESIMICSAHIQKTGFRVFKDMTLLIFLIKIGTILTHYKRSLALSSPKNTPSALVKYLLIPGLMTYMFEKDRYRQVMDRYSEQLKNKQIEQRYQYLLDLPEKDSTMK